MKQSCRFFFTARHLFHLLLTWEQEAGEELAVIDARAEAVEKIWRKEKWWRIEGGVGRGLSVRSPCSGRPVGGGECCRADRSRLIEQVREGETKRVKASTLPPRKLKARQSACQETQLCEAMMAEPLKQRWQHTEQLCVGSKQHFMFLMGGWGRVRRGEGGAGWHAGAGGKKTYFGFRLLNTWCICWTGIILLD